MTISIDMTVIAALALIAGIAAFFAPRFLGIVVGAGLIVFGVVQLFPDITEVDLKNTLSEIQLEDFGIRDDAGGRKANEPG